MNHEPTQVEIDRLIEGRELIEGCKAVKVQCVKVQLIHDQQIKEAVKEKDPDKITSFNREGVAITKADAIIYRNDRLKEMRFDVDTFAKFNREMVVAEVQWHMFKVVQLCDNCHGYDGIPPCKITCGNTSWKDSKRKNLPLKKDDALGIVKDDVFFQWIQQIEYDDKGHASLKYPGLKHDSIAEKLGFNLTKEYEADGVLHIKFGGCPEGHGLISKYQAPARFDLHWSMDLMKEVPRLHDHIISVSK